VKPTYWRGDVWSSLLVVVLEDLRLRSRRLAVLNGLSVTIARGQIMRP